MQLNNGNTILVCATLKGNKSIVEILLKYPIIDVNIKNNASLY